MKVRLSDFEIKTIKELAKEIFGECDVYIFGSRLLDKKGGDIDLLIISDKIDSKKRREILVDLQLSLGDRKIDLIITDNPQKNEFTKLAYKYGVEL